MAIENSLRKGNYKRWALECQEKRKNMISNNKIKYNKLFSFLNYV